MSNTQNEKDFTPQGSMPTVTERMESERDEKLWKIAKKRAAFKMVFMIYLGVSLMLVAIWYFTTGSGTHFWPVWPIVGWGIGLFFQFSGAYLNNTLFSKEKEFEKLKNRK